MHDRMVQSSVLVWEVWSRVVAFKGEDGKSGSAFVIDHDESKYLVTARHRTTGEACETVTLGHAYTHSGGEDPAVVCPLVRMGDLNAPHDVAVFELPDGLLTLNDLAPVPAQSDGCVFGQDCYLLGFPYLMGFVLGETRRFQLPLVRRGILSGQWTHEGVKMDVIDAIANPGMSGGPVVYKHGPTGSWRFAGVIAQSVNGRLLEGPVAVNNLLVPSGFSLATSIERAVGRIQEGSN